MKRNQTSDPGAARSLGRVAIPLVIASLAGCYERQPERGTTPYDNRVFNERNQVPRVSEAERERMSAKEDPRHVKEIIPNFELKIPPTRPGSPKSGVGGAATQREKEINEAEDEAENRIKQRKNADAIVERMFGPPARTDKKGESGSLDRYRVRRPAPDPKPAAGGKDGRPPKE